MQMTKVIFKLQEISDPLNGPPKNEYLVQVALATYLGVPW